MSLKLSFDGDEIVGSAAPRPRSLGSSAPAGVWVPAPTSRGQAHASVPREVPHFAEPRITLEQWQALVAVVDAGSYARAAESLHKTQSTVTYAVQKIESLLGVKAFDIQGRKAVLTPIGQTLYRRARLLLEEAGGLEQAARRGCHAGWEAEIRIGEMETLFPTFVMLESLERFGRRKPAHAYRALSSRCSAERPKPCGARRDRYCDHAERALRDSWEGSP